MLNQSAYPSVTILPDKLLVDFSTGLPVFAAPSRVGKTVRPRPKLRISEELLLSPMTCATDRVCHHVSRPVDGFGERKESTQQQRFNCCQSNRKERFESAFEALLITPNTSGIGIFEDQQRQQSAAALELVMDRSAERTAGGCDAV